MSRLQRSLTLALLTVAIALTTVAAGAQGLAARAHLRITIEPDEAQVFVDGCYAGVVDDFDGALQSLPLPPGGHSVVIYLAGYRTQRHNIYLPPAGTVRLRGVMERLEAGEESERPVTAPRVAAPAPAGTLDLRVRPSSAEVYIDGRRWWGSGDGHFVLQLPSGRHLLEVTRPGYETFASIVRIRRGEATVFKVRLTPTS